MVDTPRTAAAPVLRGVPLVLLGVAVALAGLWGGLALWFGEPHGTAPHPLASIAFAVAAFATVCALFRRGWRWPLLGGFALAFAAVLVWWLGLEPSNRRDWKPGNDVLAYATIAGSKVTVHNIRNFDYKSETDFRPAHYDKTFDLDKLVGADLIAVYWMGPAIAHTFVSFDFGDGKRLAISIETRSAKGDVYSTVAGFFRQYELQYIIADERDVVRLRTNYRHDPDEEVYIFPVKAQIASVRQVFMQYIRQANALKDHPQFYNSLTTNCTTDIWSNTLVLADHLPFSWKFLASGYVPEALYDAGLLDTSIPFAELKRRVHANPRAHAADQAVDFSERIRADSGAKP